LTEQEINKELEEIRGGMRLLDSIVYQDYKTGKGKLSEKQVEVVQQLFKLFDRLGWQIAFNSYKELRSADDKPINKSKCGAPVKVRSCKNEHGDKTYFGIFLGEIPLSIGHSIDKQGVVTASRSMYNPAIFIPELNDIVFGCESWWGEIKSKEELDKLITDDVIKNVWYVKLLHKTTDNKSIQPTSGSVGKNKGEAKF